MRRSLASGRPSETPSASPPLNRNSNANSQLPNATALAKWPPFRIPQKTCSRNEMLHVPFIPKFVERLEALDPILLRQSCISWVALHGETGGSEPAGGFAAATREAGKPGSREAGKPGSREAGKPGSQE